MSADLAGVDLARGLKCLGEMLGRTPATPLEAWVAIWSALSNMEHFDIFGVEPEIDCDGLVTGVLALTVGSEPLRITVEQINKEPT